jgi:hypothetical protein
MKKTIAFVLLGLIASATHAAPIDWSKIKPVEEPDMVWVAPLEDFAVFGIPESDIVLLAMECAAGKAIALTYYDSKVRPYTAYRVRLKSGTRAISVNGQAKARIDFHNLAPLDTAPIADKRFLLNLKAGKPLAMIVERKNKIRINAFLLPPPGTTLDPFFKACGI